MVTQKTNEQLETEIYDKYSKYRTELASDQRQKYIGQLWDLVFKWRKKYKKDKIGHEAYMAVCRVVKKDIENKIGFLKYLSKALYNANAEYYRKQEADLLGISKGILSTIKNFYKAITKEESNAGKTLTTDERIRYLSSFSGMPEKRVKKYLNIMAKKNIISLSIESENEDEFDLLNSSTVRQPYMDNSLNTPEEEYFNEYFNKYVRSNNAKIVCKIIEAIITKKQKRSQPCYRALITLYCMKKIKDIEGLLPVLDRKVLNRFQRDKKLPNYYEIYLEYNPKTKKKGASASASANLKEFIKHFKASTIEQNP